MSIYDERPNRLPTMNAFEFGAQPVLNIQQRQFGYIQGAPGKAFNRLTKEPFFVPSRKAVPDVFAKRTTVENPIQWQAAQYQSKVAKNAVEALHAVEAERVKQAYFDELDQNNLFPRKGRSIVLPRSVSVGTSNNDGTTIYHQPSWIRAQTNQFVGDVSKNLERSAEGMPERANPNPGYTILGSNKVINMTDTGTSMSEEHDRVGKTTPIVMSSGHTQTDFPKHRVRDVRTTETNTEKLDLDNDTLDKVFAHSSKFQAFVDRLKFGNQTLQDQLQNQNNQLGNMTMATMDTFRQILKSVGFEEKSLPKTILPDDVIQLLNKVETISPVAISEVAAMRNLIDNLRAQRATEMSDSATQYEVGDQPHSAKKSRIYPTLSPIKTTDIFTSVKYPSATSHSPKHSPASSWSSKSSPINIVAPESASPKIPIAPQFQPDPTPSPRINIPSSQGSYSGIFGPEPAVGASEDTNAAPIRRKGKKSVREDPLPPDISLRRSTRARQAPDVLGYDDGFRQTSSRKTRK
ncbi:hypothetical protein BDZ88DRAFT_442794 [Geranomyces variabilis]|nr:hypothetical protein BDZ88DRAFT_442794 [Geranomyces variabilis]